MKTKVLIFYDHFYPSYKAGGPTQSIVNLVKALYNEYNLYIICKPHEMGEQKLLSDIYVNKWMDWEKKAQVYYWNYGLKQISQLKQIIASVEPEVIYFNGLYSLYFNFLPLIITKSMKVKIVLAPRGMLHEGALSQKSYKKKLFLLIFKLMGLHNRVTWHATDADELQFIKSVIGKKVNVFVASNFPNLLPPVDGPVKKSGVLIMGTVALISPMKNHLEVLRALMKIQQSVIWHIYGPVKDNDYWQQCLELIKRLPENIKVIYHGEIAPQYISDAFKSFQVMIMPSKSENFGHALAEAMSAGKPIITTVTTPFANVATADAGVALPLEGLEQHIKEGVEAFATMNNERYANCCRNAAIYIREKLEPDTIKEEYLQLFQ